MWICPSCGARNKSDERRCFKCAARQPKAISFRERNLERRLSPEELTKLRRQQTRRRRRATLVIFLVLLVVASYFFAIAALLDLPRPSNWPSFFANSNGMTGLNSTWFVSGIGGTNS